MPGSWRTVRVFISSTFRDMQAERDHLVKVVFPALRERLEPYRVHLIDIDLRWGVTREQAESDQALGLCLEQIDEARPFFLGLLGQRYGWTPERIPTETLTRFPWLSGCAGQSVTELEFQHALNDPSRAIRAVFCIRDPSSLADIPDDLRPVYTEPDDATTTRLRTLQDRVRQSGFPLLDGYSARWDPQSQRLDGLETFGRFVQDRLWEEVRAELRLPDAASSVRVADPLAEETDQHERFLESRLRVYVGREQVGRALLAFAEAGPRHGCLVTGLSGSGKSSSVAHFAADYRRRYPNAATLVHFVGASPRSTNLRDLLDRLCRMLRTRFGFTDETPDETGPLATQFRKYLQRVPTRARLLLVIDALDQLDPTDRAHDLDWLPAQYPGHVRVVMSCAADAPAALRRALARRPHHLIEVQPLAEEERREIVRQVPSLSAKTLDAEQVRLLLDNSSTANPLYLLVALEELRGFGAFEQLTERIRHLPRGDDAVVALFGQVVQRLEREFDSEMVNSVLTLLAAARRGLSEWELRGLVENSPAADDLFPILRQLRPYLLDRDGLLDFYHRDLLRGVHHQYLGSAAAQQVAHARLADYFLRQPSWISSEVESRSNERRADELPWQLQQAQRWDDLAELLLDPGLLEAKAEAGLVFDLTRDFLAALSELPSDHPRRPLLELLEESLRGDIHFLANHPTAVFQCLWNRSLGYQGSAHSELRGLLEDWLARRQRERPTAAWLRTLRPPEVPLGTAQRAVFRGHEGDVHGVAFSLDGSRLVSGSKDGTVRLWDVASGEELACCRGHKHGVWGVAFAPGDPPGEERIASASWDHTVRLWESTGS